MKKKIIIGLVIIIVLAIIGFLVYPSISTRLGAGQTESSYQTEPAKQGDISVTIGGTGTVRSNQTATIAWETSGKVAQVTVEEGQIVETDTVLAELLDSSLSTSVMQARIDLVNAQTELDEAINNSQARADAHQAMVQAQQDLEDAQDEADSKLYQRASQETIDIAYADLILANEALDEAEKVWDMTKKSDSDGSVYAAGLTQYAKARQEQQQAEYNYRFVSELPDALSVEEANIAVDQAEANLLAAKEDWEKIKDGPDQDAVEAAQTKIDIAQAALDKARLTAPFGGTITEINCQVGDLVSTGTTAVQIDDLSRLFIDVDISEIDISQVGVGQQVSITFDALTGQDFTGTVTDIAPFGTTTDGTVNFLVTVEIEDPTDQIKPGMTAAVNITVNQLDNVLLVPSRAVRTVDGNRVVYLLENGMPVAVNITLGSSADNYSQIIEGDIQEGDLIIINPSSDMSLMMAPGGNMGGIR